MLEGRIFRESAAPISGKFLWSVNGGPSSPSGKTVGDTDVVKTVRNAGSGGNFTLQNFVSGGSPGLGGVIQQVQESYTNTNPFPVMLEWSIRWGVMFAAARMWSNQTLISATQLQRN